MIRSSNLLISKSDSLLIVTRRNPLLSPLTCMNCILPADPRMILDCVTFQEYVTCYCSDDNRSGGFTVGTTSASGSQTVPLFYGKQRPRIQVKTDDISAEPFAHGASTHTEAEERPSASAQYAAMYIERWVIDTAVAPTVSIRKEPPKRAYTNAEQMVTRPKRSRIRSLDPFFAYCTPLLYFRLTTTMLP